MLKSRFSVCLGFLISVLGKYLSKNSPRNRIPASKTRSKAAFLFARTPYDNKHLDGWRGTEHRLVTHPTASLADLNGYSTRYRDIGGTRPVFDWTFTLCRSGICYLNRYGTGRKAVGNYRLSTLGEVMSKEKKIKKKFAFLNKYI